MAVEKQRKCKAEYETLRATRPDIGPVSKARRKGESCYLLGGMVAYHRVRTIQLVLIKKRNDMEFSFLTKETM